MNQINLFVCAVITSTLAFIMPTHAASPSPIVVYESGGRLLVNDGASTRVLALDGKLMKWSVSPDSKWLAVRTTADAKLMQQEHTVSRQTLLWI